MLVSSAHAIGYRTQLAPSKRQTSPVVSLRYMSPTSKVGLGVGAPAPVVQALKRQAEVATAPPVAVSAGAAAPVMQNSTVVTTWKARIVGTPGSEDPNPTMADLSAAQRQAILGLMKDVVEGRAPLAVFELNWSYLNSRAKADKKTLAIPGIEAVEIGSVRAKSARATR